MASDEGRAPGSCQKDQIEVSEVSGEERECGDGGSPDGVRAAHAPPTRSSPRGSLRGGIARRARATWARAFGSPCGCSTRGPRIAEGCRRATER
eukprot:6179501-Pleurochrysis_carterae.AAC.1